MSGLRTIVALALAAATCAGCATWDAEARARDRARGWLDCEAVELSQRSEHAWRAEGCGRHVDVACTTSDNEPECIRVRFAEAGAGAGAETGAGAEAATEAGAEAATGAGAEVATETETETETGVDAEVAAGAETAGAATEAAGAALRAAIDARRQDVLACASRERVVVRASWDASGAIVLSLEGELAGSPEEGCVRAALSDLVAPEGAPGVVLHLVR